MQVLVYIHSELISPYSVEYFDIQRLCKELLVCQKDDIDCCDSWRVKCWRHYLKAATVEGYEGMEDERLIAFLDAAAKTLPGDQKIQFRLKW